MAEITGTEKTALAIRSMFNKIGEHVVECVVADMKVAKYEGPLMTGWGQAIIEGLKKEMTPELWDEIKNEISYEIEAEVSEKTEKALRETIGRLFQIKRIAISDFSPLENREIEWILNDFDL